MNLIRRLLPSLALLIAGCTGAQAAQNGGYPSLAKRPIETSGARRQEEEQQAPVPAPAPDPALMAQVQKYRDDAKAGQSAFEPKPSASRW